MYQTICQAESIKFIINLYLNLLSTYQKAQSPRAAPLSKLGNTFNKNSISVQSVLNSLQNGKCSLIFSNLVCHIFSSANPRVLIVSLIVHKNYSYNPNKHSLILYLSTFSPSYFCIQQSLQVFFLPQPFNYIRLRQATSVQGSLLRTGTVLIFVFSLKVQTEITGFTITDSSSLRLRKLVYCRQLSLMKMLAIRMENRLIHLLLYPQPIVITSIPYLHHHKNSHSPINQLHSLILILSLAFSYTTHVPLHSSVFKYSPLTIEFELPSNQEVKHSPHILQLGHSNNKKTKKRD